MDLDSLVVHGDAGLDGDRSVAPALHLSSTYRAANAQEFSAEATAVALARHLESHPAIARVHYPGLEGHPQHALATRQMKAFGGMLSFELRGGYRAAQRFVAALQLAAQAVSLGGVETLAVHAAPVWEGSLTPEQIEQAGVSPALVRLAAGLESAADLIADVDRALALA